MQVVCQVVQSAAVIYLNGTSNRNFNYLLDNPFKTKESDTITAITTCIKIGE